MPKDLDELRERKKDLLLESDINRQIIWLETSQLKIKAADWRRGLLKAGSIYKWVAPLAGIGLGFFAARKQVHKAQAKGNRHAHNGHGKLSYLGLLAPLGSTVLRQAFNLWRRSRERQSSTAE